MQKKISYKSIENVESYILKTKSGVILTNFKCEARINKSNKAELITCFLW